MNVVGQALCGTTSTLMPLLLLASEPVWLPLEPTTTLPTAIGSGVIVTAARATVDHVSTSKTSQRFAPTHHHRTRKGRWHDVVVVSSADAKDSERSRVRGHPGRHWRRPETGPDLR